METNTNFTTKTPVLVGQNYTIWAMKMKAYLKAFELWEMIETYQQPATFPPNATFSQIKRHSEEVSKRDSERFWRNPSTKHLKSCCNGIKY